MIRCSYTDSANKIFWIGRWIIDIEATSLGLLEASVVVEKIRDAIAEHWEELVTIARPA